MGHKIIFGRISKTHQEIQFLQGNICVAKVKEGGVEETF